MKIKFYSIVLIFCLFFTITVPAYAAAITGNVYGENIGLLHFDYTTSESPFPDCVAPDPDNPNCPESADYSTYHISDYKNFYIHTTDLDYSNIGTTGFTSGIQNIQDCDSVNKICTLNGFMWSDNIGWMILDGETIESQGGIVLADSDIARVTYGGAYNLFKGYIWSEYTGWIKLSSDVFNPASPLTDTNWGVWMDTLNDPLSTPFNNPDCDTIDETECNAAYICQWDSDNLLCSTRTLHRGRPLYGFAWSEHLGWIKFQSEVADDFEFGGYSIWVPDTSPPEIDIPNYAWFANTSEIGTLSWLNFARDPESGIDLENSAITITLDDSDDFVGCEEIAPDDVSMQIDLIDPAGAHVLLPLLGFVRVDALLGFCQYTITGTVMNTAGLETVIPETIFYVRAGDLDINYSELKLTDDNTAVADGNDYIQYEFSAADLAINPIIPIRVAEGALNFDVANRVIPEADSANWVRDVQVEFVFDSDEVYFNTVSSPPSNPEGILPVIISDLGVSTGGDTYSSDPLAVHDDVIFPATPGDLRPDPTAKKTFVQIASFAPTSGACTSCDVHDFIFKIINLDVIDRETFVPYVVPEPPAEHIIHEYIIDKDTAELSPNILTPDGSIMNFIPAITLSDGDISTDLIVPGTDITVSYKAVNSATHADSSIGDISIDNLLNLNNLTEGPGFGEEVLDIRNINSVNSGDISTGRTDIINSSGIAKARYEFFRDIDVDASYTVFHTLTQNRYPSLYDLKYDFEDPTVLIDPIDDQGVYAITGIIDDPEAEDPADILIDRSDYLDAEFSLNPNTTGNTINIGFELFDISAGLFSEEVEFILNHYIGYRMDDRPEDFDDFAIYKSQPVVEGISVKRIGVQATGIVTGEDIYQTIGDREFEAVTSPGLVNLKRQMRDNVAELTRNINIDTCSIDLMSPLTELTTVADVNGCVRIDQFNHTVVAVYGGAGDLLEIGTAGNNDSIDVPDGFKYTIIVKGGADVIIKDNIFYNTDAPANTSFGLIVLENEDQGGNVYVHPEVTNIAGLLYAEGSLLSSQDQSDENGSNLYYIDDATDANDLMNQLYWQGSIVSRNTIGGAAGKTTPENVDCFGAEKLQCAQAYDLDYIRRFTVRSAVVDDVIVGYFVPGGNLFSGGGSCTEDVPPVCVLGTLPTKITLNGISLIDLDNSDVDPFYIEKDVRPAPPGFTTGAGFERTIEIR